VIPVQARGEVEAAWAFAEALRGASLVRRLGDGRKLGLVSELKPTGGQPRAIDTLPGA